MLALRRRQPRHAGDRLREQIQIKMFAGAGADCRDNVRTLLP